MAYPLLTTYSTFALLGATDWVDGYIARHFNQGSELGKILDPTADRVLLVAGAIALLTQGLPIGVNIILWIILIREILIAVACIVVAIRFPPTRFAIAGALGTIALFLGATKATVLGRGIVFSAFGAWPTRALVVVALASGLAAVILATWHFLQAAEEGL